MYAFIDAHRAADGVEPICAVLQVALLGVYHHRQTVARPERRSARRRRDEVVYEAIPRVFTTHLEV